ncbi:MAG: DNA translocase FtsK [Anaeroplasmataceae bacterium]|nr:DNA translocase FtsK [Anaeroplasmataceae bacterium]MDE6415341.1 DNA translocase FtsK [Anaeroplasmataceae bacterium]
MKKKKPIETIEFEEKFSIPQISYTLDGLLKGKTKFQRSQIVSPIHGTHVVDRMHYVDNSGKVDVDYGYDYIRDEKHISDEELIARHGTKYYEFSYVNKQLTDEEKRGTDYSKKEEKPVQEPVKENKTLSSFFTTNEDLKKEEEKEPVILDPVLEEEPEEIVNPLDDEAEFNIRISIDDEEDEEPYEYNSFDQNLPKPEPTPIHNYDYRREDLIPPTPKPAPQKTKPIYEPEEKIEEIDYSDEVDFVESIVEEPIIEEPIEEISIAPQKSAPVDTPQPEPKPKKPKYDNYKIPYKKLFPVGDASLEEMPAWLEEKKEIINQQLQAFGIDGEVITYTKGPAFTRYEIMLAQNVNVKKINSIYDNIQMALKAKSMRIQAPIPGKNTVGIEVPNEKADMVAFGDILTDEYINSKKNLMIAMGKDIDGTPVFQNIIDMPHALIAGATKSGKSVCINTLLVSLLIKNSPDQLKLILVDPKKVELSFYNNLPHLATPVIDDPVIATEALKWAVTEMERRYELLAISRVRNIEDYERKRESKPEMENLPFIVIVVDEFNDLIMQCGVEANDAIVRLAQKARAAGIHIILATQRPTVNVVSGTIKANITCRIAFRVATDADSRIILDEQGAESLLGRGDMLIKNNGLPERVQGAYISDDEIGNICDFICEHYEPDFLFTHEELRKKASGGAGAGGNGRESTQESEDLLYQIALYCIESGMCSINSIQNSFGLGFNRASRIVAILEERGIVSPKNGTKGREILVDSYRLKEMFDDIM